MSHLEILAAQIDRARSYFRAKTHLEYLRSARDIIEASAACGGAVTLNANQTRALAIYLESETALREVRALEAPAQTTVSVPNIVHARFN